MKSDITIIILLYKTPFKLIENLKNLKRFNIIILDQSNDYNFKRKLSEVLPNIKNYTLSKQNKGFAKGVNYLVKKVKSKYFFCTQPDVIIDEKSILQLKKTILRNKKNAIIAIPLINKKKINKSLKEIEVQNMTGASFLCDKKKFFEIGRFDEDFFFYWEDVELSKRIKKYKYKIFESQNSRAIHNNSKSSGRGFKIEFIRNENFIFGELLYDYKINKLRYIKIIRKLFQNLLFFNLNIIFFKFKQVNINLSRLFGILKFLIYRIKN